MSSLLYWVITGMGVVRIALGLSPFVAAAPFAHLLGFPAEHDTPTTRLMARMFGVRDIGLGVLAFYGLRHPEVFAAMVVFQALMDGGDLLSIAIPLIRRQGIDKAAWQSSAFAATGGLSWLAVWFVAA